jgi:TPP-dependent pyruvate/acetoin dehydrogenase alpha subunit
MTGGETVDRMALYRAMARARAFELALAELWVAGLISGEMHLATGEEAVAAGVVPHLREGDALALDHRPTPWLLLRGVDPVAMLKEMLGRADGLGQGRGGHMHLFDPTRLAASSGIVGAAGPLATGLALAATRLRPGCVSVATFGDGALNQGMLLESLNLAAAWRLPVLFVCKDNGWAITTESHTVTGGDPAGRAAAFGLATASVDGLNASDVARAAAEAVARARSGEGPTFLHCRCSRLDGHFLGDPMLRATTRPLSDGAATLSKVAKGALGGGGAPITARARALAGMTRGLLRVRQDTRGGGGDPLARARAALADRREELARIDAEVEGEIRAAVAAALEEDAA